MILCIPTRCLNATLLLNVPNHVKSTLERSLIEHTHADEPRNSRKLDASVEDPITATTILTPVPLDPDPVSNLALSLLNPSQISSSWSHPLGTQRNPQPSICVALVLSAPLSAFYHPRFRIVLVRIG